MGDHSQGLAPTSLEFQTCSENLHSKFSLKTVMRSCRRCLECFSIQCPWVRKCKSDWRQKWDPDIPVMRQLHSLCNITIQCNSKWKLLLICVFSRYVSPTSHEVREWMDGEETLWFSLLPKSDFELTLFLRNSETPLHVQKWLNKRCLRSQNVFKNEHRDVNVTWKRL